MARSACIRRHRYGGESACNRTTAAAATAAAAAAAAAGATAAATAAATSKAQHPLHHGRRHRLDAAEHLSPGPDGRGNTEHRPHRASEPPPLKWSDLRYVSDIKEDCNGKEAIQA